MPSRPHAALVLFAAPLLAPLPACSSSPANVHVEITAGQEQDTFSMDPKVVRLAISATSLDGKVALAASTTPGGSFELGDVDADQLLTFEVTGTDSSGAAVVRGRSLSGVPAGSDGATLPIFVERKDRWSRPPGGLPHTHVSAPAGVLGEQYVYLGGGAATGPATPAEGDFYDLLNLKGKSGGALPRVPDTLVSTAEGAILINAAGATRLDSSGATELVAPPGLSFADIAGGRPVEAGNGQSFVVGATRPDKPTAAVLIVATDGTLNVVSLNQARAGAAAIWVKNVGLVVAGGSASGAGVEVLADGSTTFVARGVPADPISGAGAVLDPRGGIALLGGSDGGMAASTRRLDPACASACSVEAVKNADLPGPIGGLSVFALSGGRVIAVGDEIGGKGMTRSFLVDLGGSVTELALREPRMGASVIPAPSGTLAILGGLHEDGTAALSVELLFPE